MEIRKIVITGGPSAGKTTGLSWGQRVVLYQSGSLSEWHF